MPDDRLVVGRDCDVGTLPQAAVDELDVGTVDVSLVRVCDLGRLEVGPLDDAEVGREREQSLEVVGSPEEVRLEHRADVVVPGSR